MDGIRIWVDELEAALLAVDRAAVGRVMARCIAPGRRSEEVEEVIVPALERIGLGWEAGKVSLSQVYMAGRLCEELVNQCLPSPRPEQSTQPRVAIAVLEDFHMLGHRIVYSSLRAAGISLVSYGRVTVDELVDHVHRDRIAVLLISVLMLPSALRIAEVVARLRAGGSGPRIVVGGAPFRFDSRLAEELGADACGHHAAEAVALTRRMLEGV